LPAGVLPGTTYVVPLSRLGNLVPQHGIYSTAEPVNTLALMLLGCAPARFTIVAPGPARLDLTMERPAAYRTLEIHVDPLGQ
jgi:hypothetical protein